MGWIYKITNQINGKVYIGKTEDYDPYRRWEEHQRDARKERCEKRPFYDALNKYGVENFIFNIVDQSDDSDQLCKLEKFYIEKFRSYVGFKDCNGYNATLGGDGKCYLDLDEQDVINYHIKNGYISGITAKYFGVGRKTIINILKKHNVKWLSSFEITEIRFMNKYGGLVQIYKDEIINIFDTPMKAVELTGYNGHTLNIAYSLSKTHKAYGCLWYRLSELPEEYKPLLDEYYRTHKK